MVDLTFGIYIMLAAVLVAHAAFVQKMLSLGLRSVVAFLAASSVVLLAVFATLAFYPAKVYLAGLVYVAAFLFLAFFASRNSPSMSQLRARALAGSVVMLLAVALAWWLAFAPR